MNKKTVCLKEFDEKERLKKYLIMLENSCSDFSDVKVLYEKACLTLRSDYKYIDDVIECNNAMVISNLEFAFEQGLNDNLYHFKNPNEPTFMDNDYSECLKEKEMHEKASYLAALRKREMFLEFLPDSAKDAYDAVMVYYIFLDTYIPKMAHYYGFTTGNTILKNALKHYHPDIELSIAYKEWLDNYLDLNL